MNTFTIDTQNAAPFAVVEADTPRAALAAMFQMVGQGEEPTAGEYVETWSKGDWTFRVGQDDRVGGFAYFAQPEA